MNIVDNGSGEKGRGSFGEEVERKKITKLSVWIKLDGSLGSAFPIARYKKHSIRV